MRIFRDSLTTLYYPLMYESSEEYLVANLRLGPGEPNNLVIGAGLVLLILVAEVVTGPWGTGSAAGHTWGQPHCEGSVTVVTSSCVITQSHHV